MDRNETRHTPRKQQCQKKYRRSQVRQGLVRFELQVEAQTKARFDQLVDAVAEEYTEPWDKRHRIAKARAHIFDEITQGIMHEFQALQDQITALKAEIQALSPSFFKSNADDQTPLPEAILALPNDPQRLKALLANSHREAQHAKRAANQYQRHANQYQALYETSEQYTMELEQRLKETPGS